MVFSVWLKPQTAAQVDPQWVKRENISFKMDLLKWAAYFGIQTVPSKLKEIVFDYFMNELQTNDLINEVRN